mgnify:CR=1 FL=1
MENNELTAYLYEAINRIITGAQKSAISNPKQAAFLVKMVLANKKAYKIRKDYEENGIHIPAFLIASITSNCNLYCSGCYARANKICGDTGRSDLLTDERWEELFGEARAIGVSFILLAGGEPLLRAEVLRRAAKIKEIIFPVFTNGTVMDSEYVRLFDKNRNLFPVVSLEGNQEKTDLRRGAGTCQKIQSTMNLLKSSNILFGASVTVTTQNYTEITSDEFITGLYHAGCRMVFFIEYVPVNNTHELAPTESEREYLSDRQSELRIRFGDMMFLSFPGDEKFTGGCLAAGRGFFHINPFGNAEPCPFSPYSDISLKSCGLKEALQSPLFQRLKETELVGGGHNGGCALFLHDDEIKRLCLK